ncbi:MAG: amidohydrolase [Spirochaetales bacterium]|nr:amidohydrolase [Spirochaetales bacterium]
MKQHDTSWVKALQDKVAELSPSLPDIRHELHSYPETAYKEKRTGSLIRDLLAGEDLRILDPLLGTDVVCTLQGAAPGPTVLLRADMDALSMNDESGKPWRSLTTGIHHGCGHDGHMTMLIGAALTLSRLRKNLRGRVIFLFQPAEEGGAGAKRLLEAGLFQNTGTPDAAFALHGWPGLPEGVLHTRPGHLMAAQDRFFIHIRGTGGHGAMPQLTRDPVVAASALVMELQSLISREYDPRRPAVLSVCTIHGGTAENIIPESVELSGTTRYFDEEGRYFFRNRIEEMTTSICRAHRVEGTLKYVEGYIPVVNDSAMVDVCRKAVELSLGSACWNGRGDMYMTAEDFAYILDAVPGALLLLGLGETWPGLHTPQFDFNDRVIDRGVTALSSLVLGFREM